jgi:hypothetical protein
MVDNAIWKADGALSDWSELIRLSGLLNFDLHGVLRELTDGGASAPVCKVDGATTELAGRTVVLYKLTDRLQACLSALRARANEGKEQGVKIAHGRAPELTERRLTVASESVDSPP